MSDKKRHIAEGQDGLIYAKMISEMPDYMNEASRQTEKSLGPFKYDVNDGKLEDAELIMRGPYELDNGAIYKG